MKKIVGVIIGLLLFIPNVILASTTYNNGKEIANKYIYDFQDYSRYIKLTGDLPYGIDSSTNKPATHIDFKTGGFLNEKEYERTTNNGTSWLAPGIGYWLIGNKLLDVRVSAPVNANVVSGVRVTEFVKHDIKVKGTGTKTNPWFFTDGYVVKVGSSDQSLGTVIGGCEHVQDGGSCVFTLSYDANQGINTNNCKTLVESKGSTFTQRGNQITISNVHSDISCVVNFGYSNKCVKVSFNNNGGSGGMDGKLIYYKYGYGWFNDALCLSRVSGVSIPSKTGYTFNAYKNNGVSIIDSTSKIVAGIKEVFVTESNEIKAKADYRAHKYYVHYDKNGSPSTDMANSTHTYDVTSNLSKNTYTRENYDFLGWATTPTATAATYSDSQSILNLTSVDNKTINLYAVWKLKIMNVTLNSSSAGATTAGTTMIYENYSDGYYLDFALTKKMTSSANSITIPTKTGYSFKGYYTSTGGGGTKYIDENGKITSSANASNFTSAGTLYAHFVDDIKPTCTATKTSTGRSGVTFNISCNDSGTGCPASSTYSKSGIKSTTTFSVTDNAGNTGTCVGTVTTENCDCYSYQVACGSYYTECGSSTYCCQWDDNPESYHCMLQCHQPTYCEVTQYCTETGCYTCYR